MALGPTERRTRERRTLGILSEVQAIATVHHVLAATSPGMVSMQCQCDSGTTSLHFRIHIEYADFSQHRPSRPLGVFWLVSARA